MKNLFDFATKELSQDAFLRWFFANYDDEQIRPIVVDFINYFSKNQFDGRDQFKLKVGDITKLISYAQVNDIDISVDFWCENIFEGHRTIVIEDKTDSQEHNQLTDYNKAISNWHYKDSSPDKCVYKIFYKTHIIGESERKRVVDAKWTPFGIKEINDFFIRYRNKTDSDVLNDYINHINFIYRCYSELSTNLASVWNSINWETFLNKYIESKHNGVEYNFTSFRGIYDSMLIYLNLKNNKFLTYIAFEIQIRDKLIPYLHPGLHVGDKWEWSINAFNGNEHFDECKKELEDLRSFIEKSNSFIKRSNTARSFAKIDETISLDVKTNELEEKIEKWINELIRLIDLYNEGK